jgi:hypothetical protein
MSGNDVRNAVTRRDKGIRQVSRLTCRAGAAGVVGSALIAVAFGHHASSTPAQHQPSGIVVPNQPPAPASGGGAQVTSGAS